MGVDPRLIGSNYISEYDSDELWFVHWQLPFDDEHVPTLFRKIKCEPVQLISFLNYVHFLFVLSKLCTNETWKFS